MKIQVINGYSKQIGCWEIELIVSRKEAERRFNNYVSEYEATTSEEDEWCATCDDGVTWMSLEEREIKAGRLEVIAYNAIGYMLEDELSIEEMCDYLGTTEEELKELELIEEV